MQNSAPKCPSCESTQMISGGIHGMEHYVCTKCGTVLENEQFTVDVFEGGCKEVKADFDGRHFNYGFILSKSSNQNSRSHRDGLVMLKRLMDGLDLPASVRDVAVEYYRYTKRLNKIASAGAVVYLAMKDFHMPMTIRCIANYLQDQLLCLLKECMATTGYVPHLIALAAGYIVWKHSNITKWNELNMEVDKLPMRPVKHLTLSLFLSEVGISLPSLGQLSSKITLIQNVLCKLSKQLPWLSISESCGVIIHLNDFLKYKSQIIDMTAKDLAEKEKDSNKDNLMFEEDDVKIMNKSEFLLQPSESSLIETSSLPEESRLAASCSNVKIMNESEFLLQPSECSLIETSSLPEESRLAASCSKSKQNCIAEERNPAERADKSPAKVTSFIRVMDLNFDSPSPKEGNEPINKRKTGSIKGKETVSNGYDKLLLISHPYMGKRKKKVQSLRVNPLLSFP
ncbi:hypothetical protein J437_LFUL014778 [Ladona fulva]|uniref:Uncharacterized protein n=1 Tax=Ladona fulva TaxID=123851 RepID=A0A8K0KGT5_LADFU|nr:hypothetical protein J437_LFUL014778 [Ladona fulva]